MDVIDADRANDLCTLPNMDFFSHNIDSIIFKQKWIRSLFVQKMIHIAKIIEMLNSFGKNLETLYLQFRRRCKTQWSAWHIRTAQSKSDGMWYTKHGSIFIKKWFI